MTNRASRIGDGTGRSIAQSETRRCGKSSRCCLHSAGAGTRRPIAFILPAQGGLSRSYLQDAQILEEVALRYPQGTSGQLSRDDTDCRISDICVACRRLRGLWPSITTLRNRSARRSSCSTNAATCACTLTCKTIFTRPLPRAIPRHHDRGAVSGKSGWTGCRDRSRRAPWAHARPVSLRPDRRPGATARRNAAATILAEWACGTMR